MDTTVNTGNQARKTRSKQARAEQIIKQLLALADIEINGPNPWDIQIRNEGFYRSMLSGGRIRLGETYMDGWWDCQQLDELVNRLLKARLQNKISSKQKLKLLMHACCNLQTRKRALIVGKKHYDIGNELYTKMLDDYMNYSCAYWHNCNNLNQAQQNKMALICRKLGLQPGMRLLDIGCGWGGLAKYAAEHYDVEVVGVTISDKQRQLAAQRCRGLPVTICFQDYRTINERFDRIVSVGMFEHVGHKNYTHYMRCAARCLNDDGLFLLHTIGTYGRKMSIDPWVEKYIFPNGELPTMIQISNAAADQFIVEDWHNFGAYYDPTLMAWEENFRHCWPELSSKYDERFYRMWRFYLLSSAGIFRSRSEQLWQIVMSKEGIAGGYQSCR